MFPLALHTVRASYTDSALDACAKVWSVMLISIHIIITIKSYFNFHKVWTSRDNYLKKMAYW